jgi:hypothetical protein
MWPVRQGGVNWSSDAYCIEAVFLESLILRARFLPISGYGLKRKKGEEGDSPMRTKKHLLAVAAGLVCCVAVAWFSTSIQGGEKIYEVQPQITTLPEYRTDAARAIDAYERLMERYMDLMEMNVVRIGADVQGFNKRLDSIDSKLAELCTRMARIEKAFGIGQPKKPMAETGKTKSPDRSKRPVLESRK